MFGERLKYLRINDGLTQEELGKKLGVTKMVVSNWELNKGTPNYDMLKKIADIFGVSIDYLLEYNNNYKNLDYKFIITNDNSNYVKINYTSSFNKKTINKVIKMLNSKTITEEDLEKAIKIAQILKEDKKK